MAVVSTSFVLPCGSDRAVLAIQDTLDQLGWPVLELSSELIVAQGPVLAMAVANPPKISAKLRGGDLRTSVDVSVSVLGPMIGFKRHMTGIMGQFVNSVSLRIQTESIAINPTVSVGEGQRAASNGTGSILPGRDRAQQLMDLKRLRDDGALSDAEFEAEKRRVLAED